MSCAWRGSKKGSSQEGGQSMFLSCACQVHLHMENLAATCADFPWKNFPSVMVTCKKPLEIPPSSLKWNVSLSLTAFSLTFIKETERRGKNADKVLSSISYQELQPSRSQMPQMAKIKGFSFTITPYFH